MPACDRRLGGHSFLCARLRHGEKIFQRNSPKTWDMWNWRFESRPAKTLHSPRTGNQTQVKVWVEKPTVYAEALSLSGRSLERCDGSANCGPQSPPTPEATCNRIMLALCSPCGEACCFWTIEWPGSKHVFIIDAETVPAFSYDLKYCWRR